ncbi:MAG: TonB-dependent receptor [Bacteroidota bacterium]
MKQGVYAYSSLLFLFSILFLSPLAAQQKYTISGYIEDSDSGEKLLAVNVFDLKSQAGGITNTYGFYSLTLPKDSVVLSVSYVGYQTEYFRLYLDKDVTLNIRLNAAIELETVEVVADELETIEQRTEMSTVDVPVEQIKKIPALLGEVDVFKALQLLPGVQSGGEGQSGLYVRGGSPDQNLVLLDGVPVYNASHLFGFFSVFNADAIKDVKLTKGGFPARYGGRLSSVIEIGMKEGDMKEWHSSGTVGIIASKFTFEGPIKKDKTSMIVSARRTYIDLLARPLIRAGFRSNGTEGNAGYFFHDFNAKVNHKFSEKDRVYFSVYTGKDKFFFREEDNEDGDVSKADFKLGWGNLTSAMRWNHLWNNKLFSNVTATYSRYQFDTGFSEFDEYRESDGVQKDKVGLEYTSGINDWAGRIDFDYFPNPNHYIRFGANVIQHTFKPGSFDLEIRSEGPSDNYVLDTILGQSNVNAQEFALYVEDDMRIGSQLKVNAGLHVSGFNVSGKFYYSFQPRLGLRYLLPRNVALKASFATMRQYVQLLTNEGVGFPTDLWLPTTKRVKPQDAWQAALGLAKTFDKKYELSIEGYYKKMSTLLAYREGSSLFELNDWQDRVTQGDGDAYGIEVFLQKKKGRFTGWLGYTLAWAWREFDDLNFGKRYPFKYDRRHDVSIVASYKLTERINLSATWVYGTGNAVTLANSRYSGTYPNVDLEYNGRLSPWNDFEAEFYADRNNFRMRAYHRLDVGIEIVKKKRNFTGTWVFGAYNAYNRRNPYFITVDTERTVRNGTVVESERVLKQINLFPFIPSISYRFEY